MFSIPPRLILYFWSFFVEVTKKYDLLTYSQSHDEENYPEDENDGSHLSFIFPFYSVLFVISLDFWVYF